MKIGFRIGSLHHAMAGTLVLLTAAACSSTSTPNATTGTIGSATTGTGGTPGGSTGGSPTAGATSGSGGSTSATTGGGASGTTGATTGATPLPSRVTVAAAGGFSSPFDAVLSSDGLSLYFTALGPDLSSQVFTAPGDGGAAATAVASGGFAAPIGVALSSDDQTLYIADLGVEDPVTGNLGQIDTLSVTGGTAAAISASLGYQPHGVTVASITGSDVIFFTGVDPANGSAGLFSVPPTGGTVTTIAEGAPFAGPSGIAVASATQAYVADSANGGEVIAVAISSSGTGTATVLTTTPLDLGFPAGIAVSADDSTLILSGTNAANGNDAVIEVATGSGTTTYNLSDGGALVGLTEPSGSHRASQSSAYTYVDGTANHSGAVYVIQ